MGLGGVAIAVLPSVVYPQTVVLGQAGGVSYSVYRLNIKNVQVCHFLI